MGALIGQDGDGVVGALSPRSPGAAAEVGRLLRWLEGEVGGLEQEQLSGPHFLFAVAHWPHSHPPGGRHRPRRGGGSSCLFCGKNA